LLDYPKSEVAGFVNGMAAQRCEAPLTKTDSSDRLHATIPKFLATSVTKMLDHNTPA